MKTFIKLQAISNLTLAWLAQMVGHLGLRSGDLRFDSWVQHILSQVVSYW